MTDRDEMIFRALEWQGRNNFLQYEGDSSKYLADFAIAEIARAEADLRAKLVAEIEVGRGPESQWNTALAKCIEIVRGESKES